MISWMKYVRFSHSMTHTLKRVIINRVSRRCKLVSRRILAKRCRCLQSCKSSHSIQNKLEFSSLFDHTSSTPLNFNQVQTEIVKTRAITDVHWYVCAILVTLLKPFSHALGGAGGCGKSQVIEAISDYMHLQGR